MEHAPAIIMKQSLVTQSEFPPLLSGEDAGNYRLSVI